MGVGVDNLVRPFLGRYMKIGQNRTRDGWGGQNGPKNGTSFMDVPLSGCPKYCMIIKIGFYSSLKSLTAQFLFCN